MRIREYVMNNRVSPLRIPEPQKLELAQVGATVDEGSVVLGTRGGGRGFGDLPPDERALGDLGISFKSLFFSA